MSLVLEGLLGLLTVLYPNFSPYLVALFFLFPLEKAFGVAYCAPTPGEKLAPVPVADISSINSLISYRTSFFFITK